MIKNIYSVQWIQGTLLFRASTSSSKVLKDKIFQHSENFRATLFFRAIKLFKNLNDKKISDGPSGEARKGVPPLP